MEKNVDLEDKQSQIIFDKVKQWITDYVIGLELCPFASFPFEKDLVHMEVCGGEVIKEHVETFINSCNELISTPSESISTTLIVFEKGLGDFEVFLDVLTTFEIMLSDSNLDQVIQLASFHPNYQFQNTENGDVTNYTNCSPYPIIQLLRVNEVEKAIERYGDTQKIFEKNMAKMIDVGEEKLKAMLCS